MFDLAAALPALLPKAISWAEAEAALAQSTGTPLDAVGVRLANAVGVQRPELVRVVHLNTLPLPTDPELRTAALQTGLLGPGMIGLTLGYSILIVNGYASNRVVSHECRHVNQYEVAGSIAAFLPLNLAQIVAYGYEKAPYEVDARSHERDAP